MKKILKWLTAYLFAAVVAFAGMTAFADTVTAVVLETNPGTVIPAETPDGALPKIGAVKTNTLRVTFSGGTAQYASLTVVPAENGIALPVTKENVVLMQQQKISDGTAVFDFGLKESVGPGIYAMHIGGDGCEPMTRYFEVADMNTIESIAWTTEQGSIDLAESASGKLPAVKNELENTVTVTFKKKKAGYASLTAVPVIDGVPAAPTEENVVLMQQQYITNGAATFRFLFKESLPDGVYALYAGGTDTENAVRYFAVSTRFAPELRGGETFQYDDYKNSIVLGFDVKDNVNFEDWAKQKDAMEVTLRTGGNTAKVSPADITFDTSEKTICIQMQNYRKILPTTDTVMEGNMQTAEIEIVTPGYWANEELGGAQRGSFTLITPKVSAEGFSSGVDFEIELYSENGLDGANAIIALYDDGTLVDLIHQGGISLTAGGSQNVLMTFQTDKARESGKFSMKVMLWDAWSAKPLTTCVVFPK